MAQKHVVWSFALNAIKLFGNNVAKVFAIVLILCLSSLSASAASSRNLTVFTEPNTAVVLTKVAREFSQRTNTIISVNFDLSQDLIGEIDSGEVVDVLISAHPDLIDALKHKGLIDVHSVGYVAGDRLVLAASNGNDNAFTSQLRKAISLGNALQILDQNNAELLIDHQGTSSGRFSSEFLQNQALPNLKFFNKIAEDKSPILTIARKNSSIYALLLASQIKNQKDFVILAQSKNTDIFFQALVIAGDNMETSREFVKFLKSDFAKAAFKEAGFDALDKI